MKKFLKSKKGKMVIMILLIALAVYFAYRYYMRMALGSRKGSGELPQGNWSSVGATMSYDWIGCNAVPELGVEDVTENGGMGFAGIHVVGGYGADVQVGDYVKVTNELSNENLDGFWEVMCLGQCNGDTQFSSSLLVVDMPYTCSGNPNAGAYRPSAGTIQIYKAN